nr:RNA pyrophosphohydrolase [Ameyamaea chiangmaiensis]
MPYRPNVGAMIFNRDGYLFIARRSDMPSSDKDPDSGIWQCPQGGIDTDEVPDQAVLREVQEEIGTKAVTIIGSYPDWLRYDLPDHLIGKALGGRYRGQTQKWFALRFMGADADIRLDCHLPAEFDAWRWIAPERLFDFDLGFKRNLYATLLPALAPYAQPN